MKGGIILRWHLLGLRNTARAAVAEHAADVFVSGAAGLALVIYNVASAYSSLSQAAPMLRAVWPRVAEGGIAATTLAGVLLGQFCRRRAERRAQHSWLAVLPWPQQARFRAMQVASLAFGGALLPLPALCGWGVSHAVHAAHEYLAGPVLALCFSVSFAAGALPPTGTGAARGDSKGMPAARQAAWLWRLTDRLDARAPRWLGLWAQRDSGRSLTTWWVLSLLGAGGFAAGVTLAQMWIWPSVVVAVAGGNLAFLVGLRAAPLQSAVLRASALHFGKAWAGIVRGPLALSAFWFFVAASPAMAVSAGAWRPIAGAGALLLALNALFCTALAASPGSRQRAVILYACCVGIVIYQGAEYGVAYGALTAFAAACVCALLWRRARRRFRFNG